MESKISFCRNCGAQLDGSAKVCPQCGSKNTPTKRPVYKKWWFWVIIVVIVIGAVGAGNAGPKKVGENKPAGTAAAPQPDNTEWS